MGFFGSMRLLFVRTMTFMPAMRTVSVIERHDGRQLTSPLVTSARDQDLFGITRDVASGQPVIASYLALPG